MSMGGVVTQYDIWAMNSNLVPTVNFGMLTSDPARACSPPRTSPGPSTANLQGAQPLHPAHRTHEHDHCDARLDEDTGEYNYMGTGRQRARLREGRLLRSGLLAGAPNLTLNAGLRYDVQYAVLRPEQPLLVGHDRQTSAAFPGAAAATPLQSVQARRHARQSPPFDHSQRARRLRHRLQQLRAERRLCLDAGNRERLSARCSAMAIRASRRLFTSLQPRRYERLHRAATANPGIVIDADPRRGTGNLTAASHCFPAPPARTPAFPSSPVYPLTDVVTEDINLFDPRHQVPYADTWSAGIQRASAPTSPSRRDMSARGRAMNSSR